MRIIASALALTLIGIAAPAASACRIGPTPILVAVWDQVPTADQLRPGEVALEVTLPTDARMVEPIELTDPNLVILPACNPDQKTLFQIVRVLSGDAWGAEFVVVPGWILPIVPIDPATGEQAFPTPERWFVVGALNAQYKYVVAVDDPAAGAAGQALPALSARWPPQ
jgi:hypothetical protein